MTETHPAIDPIALRKAFGTFVTGVTIVTTYDADGNPRGMTANSFTSVSLDPPLLLICVGKSAASYEAFCQTESFAVNFLHEGQVDVSGIFASKTADKFGSVRHHRVHTGAPILADSLSWFDCTVFNRVEAGDHVILIGEVRAFGTSPQAPLGFCRGRYASVKDPLPEGWLEAQGMVIGYLVEANNSVLLRADGKGGWVLPVGRKRKADTELKLALAFWGKSTTIICCDEEKSNPSRVARWDMSAGSRQRRSTTSKNSSLCVLVSKRKRKKLRII